MKKLIVSLSLAAFAMVSAVQAGEGKECDASKAACAEKAKACCTSSCSGKETKFTKRNSQPPKGAMLLVKR